MIWLVLVLIPVAFAVSLPLTALMIRLGHRLGTFDSPGVPGQIKAERRRIPNTGGVAIFWGIALPMVCALVVVWLSTNGRVNLPGFLGPMQQHFAGVRSQTPLAVLVLGCMLALHLMGLIDDRRPMGPWIKLAIMAAPAAAVVLLFPETRLLEFLDKHVGGMWLSAGITILWFLVVINAMNFMDNMDGLSAGVTGVAAACFLAGTMVHERPQWFVAACLALLIGSCLGFLVFNYPRAGGAKIFMGDGGSLVLGFLLAFLTVRTTYFGRATGAESPGMAGGWYGVFMPLVVLAVPIYDFVSVISIRVAQGRPAFVGDTQHLSHRLVKQGLSRGAAVGVICGLTAITGISGIALGSLLPWQAVLAGVQTILILIVVALFEYSRARAERE